MGAARFRDALTVARGAIVVGSAEAPRRRAGGGSKPGGSYGQGGGTGSGPSGRTCTPDPSVRPLSQPSSARADPDASGPPAAQPRSADSPESVAVIRYPASPPRARSGSAATAASVAAEDQRT